MSWLYTSLYIESEVQSTVSNKLPTNFQIGEHIWLHLNSPNDDGTNTTHILSGIVASVNINSNNLVTYDIFLKLEDCPIYTRIKNIAVNITKPGYLVDGSKIKTDNEVEDNELSASIE